MKVIEFANKNNFSATDKSVAFKMYGLEEKTEEQWFNLLRNDFHFNYSKYKTENKKSLVKKLDSDKKNSEKTINEKK